MHRGISINISVIPMRLLWVPARISGEETEQSDERDSKSHPRLINRRTSCKHVQDFRVGIYGFSRSALLGKMRRGNVTVKDGSWMAQTVHVKNSEISLVVPPRLQIAQFPLQIYVHLFVGFESNFWLGKQKTFPELFSILRRLICTEFHSWSFPPSQTKRAA